MIQSHREWLPGWRAGLLVLGLYAMLLQAFVGALAGPAHTLPGGDLSVLCSSSGEASAPGHEPATPHTAHDCVCASLCHVGGVLASAQSAHVEIQRFEIDLSSGIASQRALSIFVRALPPARGPPREGFVLNV